MEYAGAGTARTSALVNIGSNAICRNWKVSMAIAQSFLSLLYGFIERRQLMARRSVKNFK